MQDNSNDERLKILQERLAQLKQKKESPVVAPNSQTQDVKEATTQEVVENIEEKEPEWGLEEQEKKSSWVKYLILFVCGGLICFYVYNNIDTISSAFSTSKEVEVTESKDNVILKYDFNIIGNHIAITASFDDESSAKGMVNNLTVKGFKSNYFFLPDQSNSQEEIYKVFVGPYESLEETNQWIKNIGDNVKILNL